MKKLILFLSSTFIVLSILFSCSDNEDKIENVKPPKLVEKDISLVIGEKKTVKITDNGSYIVKTSNSKIKANANKGIITIEGVETGTGFVIVTESKNKVAKINVKVTAATELKLDKTDLILRKGTKGIITIKSGYGKYTLKVKDISIVTSTNTGDKIEILGLKNGTTKVLLTDSKSNFTKEITVTVSEDKLIVDRAKVQLKKGDIKTVNITEGSGKYKVNSKDTDTAIVKITGTKIEITGVKYGTAKVVVTDTVYKLSKEIIVEVTVDDLKLDLKDLVIYKGDKKTVNITSGSESYAAKCNNPSIATIRIIGTKIEVTGVKIGTTKVVVTDKESNLTKEITVAVIVDELKLDKKDLILEKGAKKTVNITSGSGDYIVNSKDPSIATVIITGTKIEITALKKGTTSVIVTDNVSNQTKKITVSVTSDDLKLNTDDEVIKKGAKGTATITKGSGDYSVTSKDSSIATATITGVIIEIKGLQEGTTKIVVTDNVSKQTKEINVEVTDLQPIVLRFKKGDASTTPFKIDAVATYFNVNVGDEFTILIEGGTGLGQYIKGDPAIAKYLGFSDVIVSSDGKNKIIQDNSVTIHINEIPTNNNVYFSIKDTDGTETKSIVLTVRAAGVTPPAPLENYTIAANGALIAITDEAIDANGKLVIPASVKLLGSTSSYEFNLTDDQKSRLKEVEIGTAANAVNIEIIGYAFEDCTVLEKVTLGIKVTNLGMFIFKNTALKELISLNSTPPTVGNLGYVFFGVSDAVLKVPTGATSNYSAWASKFTIEEL